MKCIRKGCKNKAIIDKVYGVLPCRFHQKLEEKYSIHKQPEFTSINRMSRVQGQRDKHAKDMLQPFIKDKPNEDFAKAYRKQAPNYYKEDELKKL